MNESVDEQNIAPGATSGNADDLSDVHAAMAEANSADAMQAELPGLDELNSIGSEDADDQMISEPDQANVGPSQETSTSSNEDDAVRARANYESAYQKILDIRADFAQKPNYIRKKTAEEMAFHKVKKVFGGEFNLNDMDAMKENTNNGKGVDVKLPGGGTVHLNNQHELFEKIVEFNKERGDFYDLNYLQENAPKDYERLVTAQSELETAKKSYLSFFQTKKEGYKEIHKLEKALQAGKSSSDEKSKQDHKDNQGANADTNQNSEQASTNNASVDDSAADGDQQKSNIQRLEDDIDAAEEAGYINKKEAEQLKADARRQQQNNLENDNTSQQMVQQSGLAALAAYLGNVFGAGVKGFSKNLEGPANKFQQYLDEKGLKDKGVSPMNGAPITSSFDEESINKWRTYNIQQGQARMVNMMEQHDNVLQSIVKDSEYGVIALKADEIRKSLGNNIDEDDEIIKSKQSDLDALHEQAEALMVTHPELQQKLEELSNLQDQINHTGMEIAYASRHQGEEGKLIAEDVETKTNEWIEKNKQDIRVIGNLQDKAKEDIKDNTMSKRLKESLQKLLEAINSLWASKKTTSLTA